MIENLQGRRGEIKRLKAELHLLESRRSLPVPQELLEHIFKYSVHLYGQLPERLLLVCRTFYVVAINCRALWTGLNPVRQCALHYLPLWAGTFIQSRVARSNPVPLDIDFSDIRSLEMTEDLAKKISDIPTLLQRCRSVVISTSSGLHFFQGFQPLLESLTLEHLYMEKYHPSPKPWESVGECPNLRSLKLRTSESRQRWPDHLFQQLTHLEIMMPLQKGNNPSYHHVILPITMRLRSLTVGITFGIPQPVIHQSLRTLVLVYRIPWVVEITNNLGEIVCPELRQLEIRGPFSELLSSIHIRHTQKLSDLRLVEGRGTAYDEEGRRKWVDSIVELLRSIGTVKHLEFEIDIEVVSGLVEKLEADPTLCPDLVSLRAEPTRHASKRERSFLLKLEARVSERYQYLGGERGIVIS